MQAAAASSGRTSWGVPQASLPTSTELEDLEDDQGEDPDAEWKANDNKDDSGGWDERKVKIDARIIDHGKPIGRHMLDWDREMKWGQIRSLDPAIWRTHQERFAMTPPTAPVSVLVQVSYGMATLHVCLRNGKLRPRVCYVASSRPHFPGLQELP